MNKIIISGKTDSQLKEYNIYGFSGSYLASNLLSHKPHSALIENSYWRAFLFYNPAKISYHLPQDSLGVTFSNDQVLFAIADGVSIVGGTPNNLSGHMSLDLMKASLIHNEETKYETIRNAYSKTRLKGASTLQFGKISGSKLEAHFFGSIEDLGLSYYLDEYNKLVSFLADNGDFFPQSWQVEPILRDNLILKGIVSTSDGAKFSEDNSLLLLSLLGRGSSEEQIRQTLLDILPYSLDDQSAIFIIKR